MNTNPDVSNVIDLVENGTQATFYINHVKIDSISAKMTSSIFLDLWGVDPSYEQDYGPSSDDREVVYTDAQSGPYKG